MDIKERIERFYNAELSLQEEEELYRFMCENDVPDEFKSDKEVIMAMLGCTVDCSLPEGAEERLVAMIDALDNQQLVPEKPNSHVDNPQRKIIKIPKFLGAAIAVAASLLIVFLLAYREQQPAQSNLIVLSEMQPVSDDYEPDTFDSPEEAMAHFRKSLNNALVAIAVVDKNVEKMENSLVRTLKIHTVK